VGKQNKTFRLVRAHCDDRGQLKPAQLLRFFQEAAARHASALGVSTTVLDEHSLAWMLYRVRFEVTRWPRLEEAITLSTYPSGFIRTLATREFQICDQSGTALISASSAWLVANTQQRRVIAIPEWIKALAASELPALLDISSRRVAKFEEPNQPEKQVVVSAGDIDFLKHVNNVRYAEWILEQFSQEFRTDHELQCLDIQFRKESLAGDCLSIRTKAENLRYLHRVVHTKREEELVQAMTIWRPRSL
jgi:acyl-ACP thioesterase